MGHVIEYYTRGRLVILTVREGVGVTFNQIFIYFLLPQTEGKTEFVFCTPRSFRFLKFQVKVTQHEEQ